MKKYDEKLTKMVKSILLHLDYNEISSYSKELEVGCSTSECTDLVKAKDCLDVDVDDKKF